MSGRRGGAALLLVVVAVVLLAGCGVSSGTVTDKSYSPPYITCVGTPVICTKHPQCWRLHLLSQRGDLGQRCVSRQQWESHPVGSYYEGGGS